ncbi:MAG TPA: T9SS type A sorting domain-containing protein, partial [Rhodothermales bacterium]|nr:T9SS type A sorting domain-containing protein [Rhodothermales bacterium]
MRTLLLLALVGAPLALRAQPDTTAAWRYFPLAVGNQWEHFNTIRREGELIEQWRSGYAVVDERVLEGQRYFAIQSCGRTACDGPVDYDLVRFDTTLGGVVERVLQEGQPVERWWPVIPCALAAPFNAGVGCGSSATRYNTSGGYGHTVTVGEDTVSGVSLKAFYGGSAYDRMGSDLGLIFHTFCTLFGGTDLCFAWELTFVRVGDRELGTSVFGFAIVTGEEPGAGGPTATRLALSVAPNPLGDEARVAFTLARPAAVGLEVYDGVGRRVRAVDLGGQAAGDGAAVLDLSGLPDGVYVVRLRAGAETVHRVVTRRHG